MGADVHSLSHVGRGGAAHTQLGRAHGMYSTPARALHIAASTKRRAPALRYQTQPAATGIAATGSFQSPATALGIASMPSVPVPTGGAARKSAIQIKSPSVPAAYVCASVCL
jgi:hypothetical protein